MTLLPGCSLSPGPAGMQAGELGSCHLASCQADPQTRKQLSHKWVRQQRPITSELVYKTLFPLMLLSGDRAETFLCSHAHRTTMRLSQIPLHPAVERIAHIMPIMRLNRKKPVKKSFILHFKNFNGDKYDYHLYVWYGYVLLDCDPFFEIQDIVIKGIVHPEIIIVLSFTHPRVISVQISLF